LDSQGKVLQLNNDLVYLASVGRTFLNATGDGKPEILSANTSKLAEYLTARQKILDEILNCAGLSSQAMTSAQKTAAESTSKYSFIIEKINTKIDLLKKY
jgi:hypothetical protein